MKLRSHLLCPGSIFLHSRLIRSANIEASGGLKGCNLCILPINYSSTPSMTLLSHQKSFAGLFETHSNIMGYFSDGVPKLEEVWDCAMLLSALEEAVDAKAL